MGNCDDISVSIILLLFKQANTLPLMIRCLNNQTYKGRIELILTDDGSPDEHRCQYFSAMKELNFETRFVWQEDRGFRAAAARNNGIKLAKNELLIFLDGDMIPSPTLVAQHAKWHIDANLLVGGNRKWRGMFDGTTPSGLSSLAESLETMERDEASVRRETIERQRRTDWLRSSSPWRSCFSGNLSIRRDEIVRFDERFVGWGPEDAEFAYRMCAQNGFIPHYDDGISAYHLESPASVSNIFRTGQHDQIVAYMRNTFLYFDLCSGLIEEEVFFGFPRLELDPITDQWFVIPRPKSFDLTGKVKSARNWLKARDLMHESGPS